MSPATIKAIGQGLAAFLVLILGLGSSGCTMLQAVVRPPTRISVPDSESSVLTVIVNSSSVSTLTMLRWMVIRSARFGEHVVVIRSADDTVLKSCTAPNPPAIAVPGAPVLPRDATSFQVASYRRAMAAYRALVRHAVADLRRRQRHELADWAGRCAAAAIAAIRRPPATRYRDGLAAAVSAAVASIATLEQSGVRTSTRRVIAILGLNSAADALSGLHADLNGATVVVTGLSVREDEAALQAALLEAGADQATVLTPATDDGLYAVIERGLGGMISVTLAHLSYGPAQYRLPSTAIPILMRVLRLLTIAYPAATATINGYTDDIPVPGGNVNLSWERANAVLTWLTRHGIAASRLLAVGHGAAYPIAPNRPGGQPRNRRVVILIEPAM